MAVLPVDAALNFSATSDRVDCASDTSLDNLDPFTVEMWVYPTSVTTDNLRFYEKGLGTNALRFETTAASGNVFLVRARATTNTNYETNSQPLNAANAWHYMALVFNSSASAGEVVNLYHGDLTTAPTEATYVTSTDGSGALTTDAGDLLMVGNKSVSVFNQGFPGRIGFVAIHAKAMSLTEIQGRYRRPFPIAGTTKLFLHLGWAGTGTQPNLSELGSVNNCTVTGTTVADHVPVARHP